MFNLPVREVRKILGELYSQGLVQQELLPVYIMHEDGKKKIPVRRVFWYINYRHFVYLVRLRIWMMKVERGRNEETVDPFICNHCSHTYSDIDAQRNLDTETSKFLCENCQKYGLRNYLVEQEVAGNQAGDASDERTRNTLDEQLSYSRELGREGIDDLLTALKVLRVPDNKPEQYLKGENDEKLTVDDEGKAKGGKQKKDGMKVLIDNQYFIQAEMKVDENADQAPATALPVWMQSNAVGGRSSIAMEDARDREAKKVSSKSAVDKKAERTYELGGAIDMWEFRKDLAEKLRTQTFDHSDSGSEVSIDQDTMDVDESGSPSKSLTVSVRGTQVSLSKLTEADTDRMTDKEYESYAKLIRSQANS